MNRVQTLALASALPALHAELDERIAALSDPKLFVDDCVVLPGERMANLTVRLSHACDHMTGWDWLAQNGDGTLKAISGRDYGAIGGRVEFMPGETEKHISVPILRDLPEGLWFKVALSWARNIPAIGTAVAKVVGARTRPEVPAAGGRPLILDLKFADLAVTPDGANGTWATQGRTGSRYINGELAPYVNMPAVVDGNLLLPVRREPTTFSGKQFDYSACMISSHNAISFTPGTRFKLRCKIPNTPGTCPAWWLYGPLQAEIDMFEFFLKAKQPVGQSITQIRMEDGVRKGETYVGAADFYDPFDFNDYEFEWGEEWQDSYVNGRLVHRRANYLDQPMHMIISQAVGLMTGPPPADAVFPSGMVLDRLQVWK